MTLTLGKGPLATREDVRSKLTRGDKVPHEGHGGDRQAAVLRPLRHAPVQAQVSSNPRRIAHPIGPFCR